MRIFDIISMCFRNLFRRRVRTLLTVMGVVIGTCAIIVTISLGVGMDAAQTATIENMMDLTMIEVYNYGGWGGDVSEQVKLDDAMLAQIAKAEHVTAVTPIFDLWSDQIKLYSGKYEYQGGMVGVYLDQLANFGYETKEGKLPTEQDGKQAILFGENAAYNFYNPKKPYDYRWPEPDANGNIPEPFVDPINDRLLVTIVRNDETGRRYYGGGVMVEEIGGKGDDDKDDKKDKGPTRKYEYRMTNTGVLKGNYKDYQTMYNVFIDIEFAKELNKLYYKVNDIKYDKNQDTGYNYAKVRVDDMNNVGEVAEYIKSLGFQTYSADDIREPMRQQTMIIQIILGSLGGISLLVAALGIANTMVMSIYERTREIGVMKVLGCKLSNIRTLFLMEAGSIGFLGGVFGVGISYLASFILNKVLAGSILGDIGYGYMGDTSVKISIIPLWLVGLGFAFALFVGLISGFYPANRAVKISALEAIKHE